MLRLGMVGGGPGAFIGGVHRMAARLDGRLSLTAGAFSSDPETSKAFGQSLGLASERAYGDWNEMARAEAAREDRIDAVAVVTPNHLHAPISLAFLAAGIPVICDKPLTTDLTAARALGEKVAQSRLPFILTHNYSGYPMVREARALMAAGNVSLDRAAVEVGLLQLEAGGDFADAVIAHEGQWLGGDTFLSFDRKAVALLQQQGIAAELLR